jgi:hypothetical protein
MSVELKPCPFCGGKAELLAYEGDPDEPSIICGNCESANVGVEMWNRRAVAPDVPDGEWKPCPFCGSPQAGAMGLGVFPDDECDVQCCGCRAVVFGGQAASGVRGGIPLWNSRVTT